MSKGNNKFKARVEKIAASQNADVGELLSRVVRTWLAEDEAPRTPSEKVWLAPTDPVCLDTLHETGEITLAELTRMLRRKTDASWTQAQTLTSLKNLARLNLVLVSKRDGNILCRAVAKDDSAAEPADEAAAEAGAAPGTKAETESAPESKPDSEARG